MPRSITIWAAALLLISMSGSDPMLTMAEAMPAPGPQQTGALKPRYYFPRHVKRQIVTNSTAPASATSSSSSSSSTPDLETRQSSNFLSFLQSFGNSPSLSSSSSSSPDVNTNPTDAASTTTIITDVTVIPVPASNAPFGTGNLNSDTAASTSTYTPPPPIPIRASSNNVASASSGDVGRSSPGSPPDVAPTGFLPVTTVQPTSAGQSILGDSPSPVSSAVSVPSSDVPQPSSGFPSLIISPTGAPLVGSTGVVPSIPVSDSPLVGSTGVLPSSGILQPTGGNLPESIIPPTSSASPVVEPSATAGSSIIGPFIVPTSGSPGDSSNSVPQPTPSSQAPILSTGANLPTGTGGILPSDSLLPIGSTGSLPGIVIPTSDSQPLPTSEVSLPSLPTSGIIVGITTAFSASDAPTPTSSPLIPTSESVSQSGIPLGSSFTTQLPQSSETPIIPSGVVPSSGSGITDPSPGPTAPASSNPVVTPIVPISSLASELSSLVSVITSDVNSVVSSLVPTSIPLVTDTSSGLVIPTGTSGGTLIDVSTLLPSSIPVSETLSPSIVPSSPASSPVSVQTSGIEPSAGTLSGTGVSSPLPTGSSIFPSLSSSGSLPSGVPATLTPSSFSSQPTPSVTPSQSGNVTEVTPSVSNAPVTSPTASFTLGTPSLTFVIPSSTTPKPTTEPSMPPASIPVTGTNSETTWNLGTSIIQEPSTAPSPVATASGIPTELPGMIAPPDGVPSRPANTFLGQIGFKWQLNYPFVCANDGGNQIFALLPIAIADALGINQTQVVMNGIKPFDTTSSMGFITTLAIFWIPQDLASTLAAQLRNPPDPFWHNKNPTVNDLTALINTAFPLAAGQTLGEGSTPASNPEATSTGGPQDGGALGGDMGASRPVNAMSVGVALGAIGAAGAYGAAMFFVARRYRNKKISHQRASSVPSTSRYTYGSMTGGGAFMSGGRGLGRTTPGGRDSRGSHGSSSSNGRSIRTQQISAPVMAENSLGWN